MMTDWGQIEFMKREEWIKDPDRVHPEVVYLLEEVRRAAMAPIVIHVAWDDSGHESDSTHYTTTREFALGVDFHIKGWPLLEQWLFVERFPWCGIGLYPYWAYPGLHADLRQSGREHPDLGRRWWRDRAGQYRALDRRLLTLLLSGIEGQPG